MVEQASITSRPVGMGPLTEQILEREVGDWKRFKNRRQVSSYLGLCPSEYSTGGSQRKGGITKAGNGRLRQALCQIAWRLLSHQSDYWLVKKWQPQLQASSTTTRRRKQIVIATPKRSQERLRAHHAWLCRGLMAVAHRTNHGGKARPEDGLLITNPVRKPFL